ncbi:MAG: UDP-N-acetylmuramoyl-L-alanyl-D-glutamate--2,6-diaminopimelate ligase [Treponema sp.]|jgi:UDP-N-acetylmuramoyl-L-alanyl-D-glutamate--2,6-diaminopimelate ligase|nr:UDP-N-acetylmuramoyl-L-alanyl-D-glutamate--2,6-diaminopimelate ligase [Treponema sp.]
MAEMERRLSEFFNAETAERAGFVSRSCYDDPVITGLACDSRDVKRGNIFFALGGLHTDGSLYIEDAVERGAAAVVYENKTVGKKTSIPYLLVKNSRIAMSPVAASFYNFPSRRLFVTGVTGTEGKSTTVYLIFQMLRLLGKKTGFISTVQHCLGNEVLSNIEHQTTPEAPVVQRLLYEMAENGCEYAVVEASSHGLSPRTNRLGDVDFFAAVMTNVRHEHLEFHGTWEQYRDDKANLFRSLGRYPQTSVFPFGIINADDESCDYFVEAAKCKTYQYSTGGRIADLELCAYESGADGSWYLASTGDDETAFDFRDRLPGAFNAPNVLAALLAVSSLTNRPVREITYLVVNLKPVRGRMSAVNKGQPFEVLIDYAHTPSSFLAIYPPLRQRLNKTGGRIISLFGSAGERDTQKRSLQGKIAADYSDIIIITDEDPRGEEPMAICEEIERGVTQSKNFFSREENLFLITDRKAAIRKGLSLARAGDLVLLLGKGHENSIIYADHAMPYDEFDEAEKALGESGNFL